MDNLKSAFVSLFVTAAAASAEAKASATFERVAEKLGALSEGERLTQGDIGEIADADVETVKLLCEAFASQGEFTFVPRGRNAGLYRGKPPAPKTGSAPETPEAIEAEISRLRALLGAKGRAA